MDNLAVSLQEKMFGLKDASMNQRSMIMPIFISSCDNLFYNAFHTCDQTDIPMMSADFGALLEELNVIDLTYTFAIPQIANEHIIQFGEGENVDAPYAFKITDDLLPREYPVTSLKETGTMTLNMKDYDTNREFDDYWRVRLDMVRLVMYKKDGMPIPSRGQSSGYYIQVEVEYPSVFNDTDKYTQPQMFSATQKPCTPTYYTSLECASNPNRVCFVDSCIIPDEFDETNFQPSLDGIFRFTVLDRNKIDMDLLDSVHVEFSGTRIYRA
jgi:hypothetical protein